ncbi:MAG: hypothetical protein KDB87_18830, partial [Flavobacteriales bacterium]|nr:hypothetical protein [Flavobacteriales bacterium]
LDNDGDLDVISASSAIGMLACYLNQAIGPYRIEGAAFHDANTNGVRDAAEPTLPLMQMAITPGMPQFFCGADGHFSRNVPAGTYTVTALPPAPYWTHTTPDAFTVTLADTIPLAQGLEFGFSLPDTTLLDPSVVLLAAGCADTATIHASVRNLAAPVQNGELVLELDPALTYVNATPAPTTQVGDTLTWSFQDLEPLDQEAVQVRVVMPSSSTLPYELNMPITASSALVPTLFQDTLQRPLSCTQGANDKLVDPAGLGSIGAVPLATTDLEYTIRFRNTGNAPVQSILITDQLDTQLDTASLQPVAWSHPVSLVQVEEDQRLLVRFDGILLPDSASDPVGSEGFLRFRVTPTTVPPPILTEVRNTALISFDADAPVVTNTTLTTWYSCLGYQPMIQVSNDSTLVLVDVDGVQWFLNGAPLAGADTDTLLLTVPGVYTAQVVNVGGCPGITDAYVYVHTGIAEQEPWARVRPVPASDMLYVERSEGSGGCIGLSDALGRVVVPCTPVSGTWH